MTETTQELTWRLPERVETPPPARRPPLGVIASILLADLLGPGPIHLDWIGPIAGVWLALVLPTVLLYRKMDWQTSHQVVRVVQSLALTVFGLLVLGLGMNTVLPLLSVDRPLDTVPVTLAVNCAVLALACWRPDRGLGWPAFQLPELNPHDEMVIGAAALTVLLSVTGAIRVNNGAGPAVTVTMLILAALVLGALVLLHAKIRPEVYPLVIYLVALALLLMTSLRGWEITGHDIQREFRVFQLTKANGRWDMSQYKDAYNACLSITILPTMLARLTRLGDPYIYKAIYQVLFAVTPVIVYRFSTIFVSRRLAVLAATYFMAFPTFFTDMPFLARQQVAFLFVGVSTLVIAERRTQVRHRRVLLGALSVGMVLSHYSTTYVFAALLVLTWLGLRIRDCWLRLSAGAGTARRRDASPVTGIRRHVAVIGLANIAVILLATFVWNSAITHTSKGLAMTLQKSVRGITGEGPETKSSDVSYGLFAGAPPSPEERMASYYDATISRSLEDGEGRKNYYPEQLIKNYPTPVVKALDLPVTAAGRTLEGAGLDPSMVNSLLRQGGARLMQLFVLAGLIAVTVVRSARRRVGPELLMLGWVSLGIVASQVVLPGISEDYGVLRAFQQSLFVLAPALVAGAEILFRWIGTSRARRIGEATALVLFLSCVGVLPQTLGGYPPQLHLNNAGQYYDIYYVHTEEVAGISWLRDNSRAGQRGDVQSEVQTDRYTFTRTQNFATLNVFNDIYPTLLRRDAYVFLGYNTTRNGLSTVSYQGDLITYRYPVNLLKETKSLVYSNGGVEIFR